MSNSMNPNLALSSFISGAVVDAQGNPIGPNGNPVPPPSLDQRAQNVENTLKAMAERPGIADIPWWKTTMVIGGGVALGVGGTMLVKHAFADKKPGGK